MKGEFRVLGMNQLCYRRSARSDAPSALTVSSNLALLTSKRVSVLVKGEVVPLLPGAPILDVACDHSHQEIWEDVWAIS
jgi:hypothetical protein